MSNNTGRSRQSLQVPETFLPEPFAYSFPSYKILSHPMPDRLQKTSSDRANLKLKPCFVEKHTTVPVASPTLGLEIVQDFPSSHCHLAHPSLSHPNPHLIINHGVSRTHPNPPQDLPIKTEPLREHQGILLLPHQPRAQTIIRLLQIRPTEKLQA